MLDWHWWTSGAYGDMMFSTLYPVNPQRKVVNDNAGGATGFDSLHPGGLEPASWRCQFRHGRRLGPLREGHDQQLADRSRRPVCPSA